jgi:Domain of unknown function (DUF4405)
MDMKQDTPQMSRNKVNLYVDIAIFLAFLVAMAPKFSGMAIHEWLGMAFGAAVVAHLALHWQWIIEVGRRLFSKAKWSARLNYALNLLLFVDLTVIILSGVLISHVALPSLGIELGEGGVWKMLHTLSADLFLPIVGLHVALHWQWIVNMVKRIAQPRAARRSAPQMLAKKQGA